MPRKFPSFVYNLCHYFDKTSTQLAVFISHNQMFTQTLPYSSSTHIDHYLIHTYYIYILTGQTAWPNWLIFLSKSNLGIGLKTIFFLKIPNFFKSVLKRNWVFVTTSNFLSSISLQPYGVSLCYFKVNLFDLTELIVWNI